MEVRSEIIRQIGSKLARTSYVNLLDTKFISFRSKAYQTCSANSQAAEAIWDVWVMILTNTMGFLVYLLLLSELNPFLFVVIIITTMTGFFSSNRLNEWGYRQREDEAA